MRSQIHCAKVRHIQFMSRGSTIHLVFHTLQSSSKLGAGELLALKSTWASLTTPRSKVFFTSQRPPLRNLPHVRLSNRQTATTTFKHSINTRGNLSAYTELAETVRASTIGIKSSYACTLQRANSHSKHPQALLRST